MTDIKDSKHVQKHAYPLDYQSFESIISLLLQQVKDTPHKVAVQFKTHILTYDELDRKSNQLARYLQKIGVKSETFVGCSLSNSSDLIITMLGILKAGGVDIPLDSS